MAVLTRIPNLFYPTLPQDVIDTLNANGGNTTTFLPSLFTGSANIDMYSKRKPSIFANDDDEITDEQMATAGASTPYTTAKWGLNIIGGKGVTPKDVYTRVKLYGAGALYFLPQGGVSEPLRISDFCGYYPAATQPLRGAYSGIVTINPLTGSDSYAFEFFKSTAKNEGELGFDDLYQSKDENGNTITWRNGIVLVEKTNTDNVHLMLDAIEGSFTRSQKGKSFYAVQFITSFPTGQIPMNADNANFWKDYWQYAIPDGVFELVIRNTSSGGNTGVQSSIKVDVATGFPKFVGLESNPYSDVSMKFTLRVVGGNGNVSNFSVGLYKEASCTNRVSYKSFSNITGLTGERSFSAMLSNPDSLTDLYVGIFFNGNLQNVNKVAMPIVKPTSIE